MTPRSFVHRGIFLAAAMLPPALAAQAPSLRVEATAVRDGLVMLSGPGGNVVAVQTAKGAVLVDNQYAQVTDSIRRLMDSLAIGPVRWVINTHAHVDHVHGNADWARAGATVVAHRNAIAPLRANERPVYPPEAIPTVAVAEELTLDLGDERVRLVHPGPSHSNADLLVWFVDRNVVHAGDIVTLGRFPFIDHENGGSLAGVLRVVDRLLAEINDSTRIIPGHGPMGGRLELLAYRRMLTTVAGRIQVGIAAGRTLAQLQQEATAGYESWAWRFVGAADFVELLHTDLTRRIEDPG